MTVRIATPTKYADLAGARRALGLEETRKREDDPVVEKFLEVASRHIDNYCQRDFSPWDETPSPRVYEMFDGQRLPHTTYARGLVSEIVTDDFAPPTSDHPVTVEVSHLPIGSWSTIDGESWWTEPFTPVNEPCWAISVLGSSRRNFARVTACWGWGPYVPEPISRATVMLATRLYKRQETPLGVTGTSELGTQYVRRDMDIYDLVKPYRSFAMKLT